MGQFFVEIVTSPECSRSRKALRALRRFARRRREKIILREVSIITEEGMERAMDINAYATPTIAINGRIAFVGVPSVRDMERIFEKAREMEIEGRSYFF